MSVLSGQARRDGARALVEEKLAAIPTIPTCAVAADVAAHRPA